MKKILTIVLISFLFFFTLKVEAGNSTTTFSEGSFQNVYIRYKLETGPTHLAQYKAIYRDDGKEAYCLDPTSKLKTAYAYTLVTSDLATTLNIEPSLWEEIELIMHYGYRYGTHTQEYWHAITQMLIWQKLHPIGTTFEYTSGYNGSTIKNKFDAEKQEIENLVTEHLKRPSFNSKSYTLNVGEEISITDNNGKISEYNLNNTPGISANVEGNTIKVKGLNPGDNTITVFRNYPVSGEPTAVYTDSKGGQTLGVAGDLPSYTDTINIKVLAGKIKVNINRGKDYYSNCNNNVKTVYGLYDENNTLIETFDGSNVSSYTTKELAYKNYYVKQISHACNDQEEKNIYPVTVNASNPNPEVNITVNENYKEIVLLKKYGNKFQNTYQNENGATFTIGDANKTFNLTTDSAGKATLKIGYGTYTLKQTGGIAGYSFIPNQSITVNDSTPASYYFNLINEEIVGSIDVTINRGEHYYSNCSDGNVTFYGLYAKDNNSLIRTFSGEANTYHIANLPLKKYYVKQLSNACNDKADYKLYETEINKDKLNSKIEVTVLENYKEIVLNKKYGNEYLRSYAPEENATFNIGDEVKTFTMTTDALGVSRIKLGYGTYILSQTKGIKNHKLLEEQEITINENTLDTYNLEFINAEILGSLDITIKRGEHYYSNCRNSYETLYGLYEYGTNNLIRTFKGDQDGTYHIANLSLKKYYVKQMTYACNDQADTQIYETEISEDKLNSKIEVTVLENYKEIVINKKYGNKYLNKYYNEENATFNIGDEVKTFTMTTDGSGTSRLKLGYGTYNLSQTKGIKNHKLIDNQEITINSKTTNVYNLEYINEEILGSIDVTIKRGEHYYSNCDDNVKTLYGLYDENNTLLETFDATKNGSYHLDKLSLKKYYVKQISSACNDQEDDKIYEVEINEDKLNAKVDIKVLENYKEIVINKKYGNKFLNNYLAEENATFTIGDEVKTFTITTDALGVARLKIGYGTYNLKQTKGRKNYQLLPNKVITINRNTSDIYTFALINEEILGSIKVDITRGEDYYSNCENNTKTLYGLYEEDTNILIETFAAEEEGSFLISNLPIKKYYVKQISHACNDKEDSKIYEVEIKEKDLNPEIKVKVLENYVELTLNKKYGGYLDNKYTLEKDASFTIGDDHKVFDLVTNTKGNARIKLGYGTYHLKQILGKENYTFIEEQDIVIDKDTPIDYVIELINEEILSNIKVILKDEEGNLLSGVVVGLYKGTKKVSELITNDQGEVYFTNLNLRDYTLKQLSVPEGYEEINNNETITLTKEDGLVVFINKKKVVIEPQVEEQPPEEIAVPDTYVNGDGKVIKISSMLLTMAFYIFVYGKKKHFNN